MQKTTKVLQNISFITAWSENLAENQIFNLSIFNTHINHTITNKRRYIPRFKEKKKIVDSVPKKSFTEIQTSTTEGSRSVIQNQAVTVANPPSTSTEMSTFPTGIVEK